MMRKILRKPTKSRLANNQHSDLTWREQRQISDTPNTKTSLYPSTRPIPSPTSSYTPDSINAISTNYPELKMTSAPPPPAPLPCASQTHFSLPQPLRNQMKRLFILNLRLDQKRTLIHHHMQQDRYMDVFHGPPYDRVQHWNRCLARVGSEYDDVQREVGRWRGMGDEERAGRGGSGREDDDGNDGDGDEDGRGEGGGEGDGLVEFVKRVEGLADEIEGLIEEIDGVE